MSLTTCLKKFGDVIDQGDRKTIEAEARRLRTAGEKDPDKAALAAIDAVLKLVEPDLAAAEAKLAELTAGTFGEGDAAPKPTAQRWATGSPQERAEMLKDAGRPELIASHSKVAWDKLSDNLRATLLHKTGEALPKAAPKPVTPQVQQVSAGGRTARSAAWDRNPLRVFLATNGVTSTLVNEFAPGPKERRSAMVPGVGPIFKKAGLQLDELAQRAVEEGFLPTADATRMHDMIAAAMRGERIAPLYAEGGAEQEFERRLAEQREREADAALDALPDGPVAKMAQPEQNDDDIPWGEVVSNASTEDAMQALGFTQQEIDDAIAQESREPQEDRARRGGADEAATAAPPSAAGRADEQARADAAESASAGQQAGLTWKRLSDGTLAVKGDSAAIRRLLPDAKLAQMKGGLAVGKKDAAAAERILSEPPATPQDLLGDAPNDSQQAAARARAEREEKARRQREAAPEPGDFTLSGSDRPADVGAAAGQGDLLAEPAPAPAASAAAARTRPRNTITFTKPITGPTGRRLVSYTWQWKPVSFVDQRGEDRMARVSDWDKAATSAETGRDVVHQFTVESPDGTSKTVSAETALGLMGYADMPSSAGFRSTVSAAKTLARLRMQQAEVESALDAYEADEKVVRALERPEITGPDEKGWYSMGSTQVRQIEPGQMRDERRRALEQHWVSDQLAERGWSGGTIAGESLKRQAFELADRIKRAEKKLAELAPMAAPAPTTVPAGPLAATEPANTEDAGAELTFNRRNRIKNGLKWADVKDKDAALKVREVTKDKVYPRPDYAALADEVIHPIVAHIVKQAYDAIAVKPTLRGAPTDEHLQLYIQGVNRYMEGVLAWARNEQDTKAWLGQMAKRASILSGANRSGAVTDITALAEGAPKSLLQAVYPDVDGQRAGSGWRAFEAEVRIIGGNKALSALQPSTDEVIRAMKDVEKGWPGSQEAWQRRGYYIIPQTAVIKEDYYQGEHFGTKQPYLYAHVTVGLKNRTITLNSKRFDGVTDQNDAAVQAWMKAALETVVGKHTLMNKSNVWQGSFATEEEAKEKARELTKRDASGQMIDDRGIKVEHAERIGQARRKEGEDVSSDQVKDTFGFKGVNFGTWMKGQSNTAERQLHLNHAYDAFLDLAEILGVPPRAMSLDGMLGLAIGAQGSGGGAAAHFVPGVNEINLTREAGAGSLAHEWGHALDHYFARQAGLERMSVPFLTEYTDRGEKPGIRPEILQRFRTIVQAMNKRPITEQEAKARSQARMERARKSVDDWLKAIARDFEGVVPAKDLEALLERLRKGDAGDYVGSGRAPALRSTIAALRDDYRRAKKSTYPIDKLKAVQSNVEHLKYLLDHQNDAHEPQMVSTDYARNAAKLDEGKGGKSYWSTNLEKWARAFDAFVSDKLAERAAKNSYLSHTGRAGETVPMGEERTSINTAFQALVDTIETRVEDDGDVVMFALNDPMADDWEADGRLAEALARYDDTGESTGRDLLADVRFLIAEGVVPDEVEAAADAYEAEIEDNERVYAGRGDEQGAEEAFAAAVRRAVGGTPQFAKGPVWRSDLEDAITASTMKTAPAQGWQEFLTGLVKRGGAKADEVEWSGIREWLKLMGSAKVSKEQVLAFLGDNGVKLDEVELGGAQDDGARAVIDDLIVRLDAAGYTVDRRAALENGEVDIVHRATRLGVGYLDGPQEIVDAVGNPVPEHIASMVDALHVAVGHYEDVGGGDERPTQYGGFTLPGGESYKELLLTLPRMTGKQALQRKAVFDAHQPRLDALRKTLDAFPHGQVPTAEYDQARRDHDALMRQRDDEATRVAGEMPDYRSSHWSEPNIVAHIRMNERTSMADGYMVRNKRSGNEGQTFDTREEAQANIATYQEAMRGNLEVVQTQVPKRTLFVEEIQSDWGAEGRRKGFGDLQMWVLRDAGRQLMRRFDEGKEQEARALAAKEGLSVELEKVDDVRGVPRGPFVQNTDAWLTLALKRIVRYAADNGMDRVAFVNGQQSADRYDLSKHISHVRFEDNHAGGVGRASLEGPHGMGRLVAYDLNGRRVIDKQLIDAAKELPDLIGKEAATRLLDQPGKSQRTEGGNESRVKELRGLDLKVGGEGMVKFYDAIVPAAANKLLAKLGGGKVFTLPSFDPQPEAFLETVFGATGKAAATKYRAVLREHGKSPRILSMHADRAEAEAAIATFNARRDMGTPQPAFDITPAMKETAGRGMPMFARGDRAPGVGMEELRARVEQIRGAGAAEVQRIVDTMTAGWKDGPPVHVVPTWRELPPRFKATAQARGVHSNGEVWIVAAAHRSGEGGLQHQVGKTLAHEAVAHFGLRQILGADFDRLLVKPMQLALASGNKPLRQLRDEVRHLYRDKHGKYLLTPRGEADEIAARAVEQAVDAEGNFRPGYSWLKAVWAKVAQFLRDRGINVKFTQAELHGMLVLAMRGLEAGERTAGGAEVVVSGPGFALAKGTGDATVKRIGDQWVVVRNAGTEQESHLGSFDTETEARAAASVARAEAAATDRSRTGAGVPQAQGTSDAAEIQREGRPELQGLDVAIQRVVDRRAVDSIRSSQEALRRQQQGTLKQDPARRGYCFKIASEASAAGLGDMVIGIDRDSLGNEIWHAVIQRDGAIYDPTMRQWFEPGVYEALGFTAHKTLTPQQVRQFVEDSGGFAPDAKNQGLVDDGGSGQFALADRTGEPAQAPLGGWQAPEDTRTDKLIFELQDGRIDLKRVQQAITAAGGEIQRRFDARLAETLYPGRVARRTENFINREAKPLLQAMARIGADLNEVGDYLIARHAPERNAQVAKVNPDLPDGGAGRNSQGELMTTEAAQAYLEAIPAQRRALLDELARAVDKITAGTRNLLVAEGLEKQKTIDAWNGAYENYVPLFKEESEHPHPQGMGFTVRGPASKRATGSTKQVQHVLAHVLMQREAAIARAEKNRVGLALYGLALSNPNRDFWTTIKPGMPQAQITRELQAMGVDPALARSGMGGVPTIREVSDITGQVVDRPNPLYKSLPGAITLRINGEDRVLMLNEQDPRAARLAADLKNLDGMTRIDIAGSIVGKATRWMAAVSTAYNPAFGVMNFVRDVQGGVVNLTSTPLRRHRTRVLSLVPAALQGITRGLATGGESNSEWAQLWEQFQADGGRTGYRDVFAQAEDRAKAIEREIKRAGRSVVSPARAGAMMLDLLGAFNTTLENAVRLAAYRVALDKGISRAEAARLARELTVDFNRKGRTVREIGPIFAFLNASVQGTARTLQTLTSPGGAEILAGGLAVGAIQALLLAAAGYDDDELPEFVKTRSLIIPLPRGEDGEKRYIAIAYSLGLHVIPNTGRVLTELALNGGKNLGKRTFAAVGEVAAAFNPLGGGNIFTADGALKTIAPTVIDPVVEIAYNKDFTGRPIERELRGQNDPRPGPARARESTMRSTTGQAYLEVSKAINAAFGGSPYQAAEIGSFRVSPTPEMVRYVAHAAGGGLLREIEKGIDSSVKAARDEPVKPYAVPLFGRFYGEVDQDQVTRSRYYDNKRRIEKFEAAVKAAEKAGDTKEAQRLMKENAGLRPLADMENDIERKLRELNKRAVTVVNNAAEVKRLDEDRARLMRALNDNIRRLEEQQPLTPAKRLRAATEEFLADPVAQ